MYKKKDLIGKHFYHYAKKDKIYTFYSRGKKKLLGVSWKDMDDDNNEVTYRIKNINECFKKGVWILIGGKKINPTIDTFFG